MTWRITILALAERWRYQSSHFINQPHKRMVHLNSDASGKNVKKTKRQEKHLPVPNVKKHFTRPTKATMTA